MAGSPPLSERTDLIDVDEIDANSLEDFSEPITDRGHIEAFGGDYSSQSEGVTTADASDRTSAAIFDFIFLYIMYWPLMLTYRLLALDGAAGPIPVAGAHGLIFHSLFILLAAVIFIVMEVTMGATVGKLICGLRVLRADALTPSVSSIIVRNLMKPVDLLLMPLLVPFACFEWTSLRKRLGDLLAGTVVFKKQVRSRRQIALSIDVIASATTRSLAFALDFSLAAVFIAGYVLLLSPSNPVLSMLLVVMFPVAILLFFALPECLLKTSAGKWIFGLIICHEDGTVVSSSGALIRSLWLSFDANPIGFMTMFCSLRKQRAGDLAAQTVVIKAKRELIGFIAVLATILITAAFFYVGSQNRDSVMHTGFQVNFLPSADFSGFAPAREISPSGLGIMNFNFAEGEGDTKTPKRPAIYEPGETVTVVFQVTGYTVKGQKVWLEEDIAVNYPDGTAGLKIDNISEYNDRLRKPGPISFENTVALPEDASPGRYSVTITLRDRISQKEIKEQRFFYVSPREQPPEKTETKLETQPKEEPIDEYREPTEISPPPEPSAEQPYEPEEPSPEDDEDSPPRTGGPPVPNLN